MTLGDWRIVSLVRLSPLVPYVLSNYLFGVTKVRFVPYLLAGWIAQMPGLLLYVMLGHAGRRSLDATEGSGGGLDGAETALLLCGIVASAILVVYLTKLAKRALAEDAGADADEPAQGPT